MAEALKNENRDNTQVKITCEDFINNPSGGDSTSSASTPSSKNKKKKYLVRRSDWKYIINSIMGASRRIINTRERIEYIEEDESVKTQEMLTLINNLYSIFTMFEEKILPYARHMTREYDLQVGK